MAKTLSVCFGGVLLVLFCFALSNLLLGHWTHTTTPTPPHAPRSLSNAKQISFQHVLTLRSDKHIHSNLNTTTPFWLENPQISLVPVEVHQFVRCVVLQQLERLDNLIVLAGYSPSDLRAVRVPANTRFAVTQSNANTDCCDQDSSTPSINKSHQCIICVDRIAVKHAIFTHRTLVMAFTEIADLLITADDLGFAQLALQLDTSVLILGSKLIRRGGEEEEKDYQGAVVTVIEYSTSDTTGTCASPAHQQWQTFHHNSLSLSNTDQLSSVCGCVEDVLSHLINLELSASPSCNGVIPSTNLTTPDASPTSNRPPTLLLHSYLSPTSGYGGSAQDMLIALMRHSPHTSFLPLIVPYNTPPSWASLSDPTLVQQVSRWNETLSSSSSSSSACLFRSVSDVYLGYFVPHERDVAAIHPHARKAKVRLLYTTFETTHPPVRWLELAARYDRILVSCDFMKQTFENQGLNVPIGVVPLGVNVDRWPHLPNRDWSDTAPFTFLLAADGRWASPRKNYQLVLDAFLRAFPEPDGPVNAHLIIKVTDTDDDVANVTKHIPRHVQIFTGRLASRRLLTLFFMAHCFVFASHGEGYGLPPREAMATGIPVMVGGFAGLAPLAHPDMAFPLSWSYELADPQNYEGWKAENNNSTDFGHWARIEEAHLADQMVFAATHRDEVRRRGQRAAEWVRVHESYQHTASRVWAEIDLALKTFIKTSCEAER
eukprot:c17951_g1_i1.p1 GENE.c17951_g1_i1~~c17951_g1_i1.p1  ORF type:complete len:714 (+),score=135.49 c17951_g1_i1:17-2158(+)